jgi:hypothetical protein
LPVTEVTRRSSRSVQRVGANFCPIPQYPRNPPEADETIFLGVIGFDGCLSGEVACRAKSLARTLRDKQVAGEQPLQAAA